ncbi:MAG: hypothetical protein HKM07_03275 [Chlamydiae bacterium]|nr:hypothetical protein [Chlamydiota bacterium]
MPAIPSLNAGSAQTGSSSSSSVSTGSLSERRVEVLDPKDGSSKGFDTGYCVLKVVYYTLKFFAVLLYIPLKALTLIPNTLSYLYNKNLNHDIYAARLEALKKGLTVDVDYRKILSPGPGLETQRELCKTQIQSKNGQIAVETITNFVDRAAAIMRMIDSGSDPDAIREKITLAMSTDVYQVLKNEEENPVVTFLQILSVMDLSTDGEKAFKRYGEKVLGELNQDTFTWGELATQMDRHINVTFAYQRNSWYTTLFWMMANPIEAVESKEADWFPLEFNGHKGNPNLRGEDFRISVDGKPKTMRFYYGPGPTGDHLYHDGVLVYMDKLNKKGVKVHELRQNYQNMEKYSEAVRIREMAKYEREHPDSMRLLSLSFDTDAMKMTTPFMKFSSPQEFLLLYAKYVMAKEGIQDTSASIEKIEPISHRSIETQDDNGVFAQERTISDMQFKNAFFCAEQVFTTLTADGTIGKVHWDDLMRTEKGQKRVGRVMQLATQGIISLGALCKSFQDIESMLDGQLDEDLSAARVSGACKQDIDRAIVQNITVRLFFRLLTNDGPLMKDEIYSIAGAVIGRAEIVEGRLIQWSRYEILSDLLHFVGDQKSVQTLSLELRKFAHVTDGNITVA